MLSDDKRMPNPLVFQVEEFEIFMQQLQVPARDCPKLQSLLASPSVFDE